MSDSNCYATLGGYNSHMKGTINSSAMVVGEPSQRIQQIPVWGGIGYDALSHGVNERCGGYFTIGDAYPHYNKKCGRMMHRACGGSVLRK